MTTVVKVSRQDARLVLTIDRPERRNALNADVIGALREALQRTKVRRHAPCRGAHRRRRRGLLRRRRSRRHAFEFDYATPTSAYADLLRTARTLDVPSRARQRRLHGRRHGPARDVRSRHRRPARGLRPARGEGRRVPDAGAAVLQAQVPQRFLTQLCLTGDPIDAARARQIGLVNEVAHDLDGALERLLSRLQSNSPTALRRGLYAMKAMRSMSFERRSRSARADRPAGDDAGRARGHRRIQGQEETAMDRQVKPRATGKVVRIGGASGFWGDSSLGPSNWCARAASTTWCSTISPS
jgi:hypothetical protein